MAKQGLVGDLTISELQSFVADEFGILVGQLMQVLEVTAPVSDQLVALKGVVKERVWERNKSISEGIQDFLTYDPETVEPKPQD